MIGSKSQEDVVAPPGAGPAASLREPKEGSRFVFEFVSFC